jgi:hypothetical protein
MAPFPKTLKELCRPALIYFIISIIALVMLLFQNLRDNSSYNVGSFSCSVPNTAAIFVIKLIYILFWTYVLNLICKDGNSTLSWLLLLFPFLLFFVIIGIMMVSNI